MVREPKTIELLNLGNDMTNTNMTRETMYDQRAVGVFKRREDVEATLQALKDANIDMDRVSLIARHVEDVEGSEEISGRGNEAKEGAAAGATTGTVLGGIGGFLVGVGVLAIPGVGPILAAGVGIPALASTLAGAGIGAAAGGIIGALVGAGIPEDKAREYSDRVKAGQYLLLVNGNNESLRRIESIMRDHHVEDFNTYNAPDLRQTDTAAISGRTTHDVTPQPRDMTTQPRKDIAATRRDATETRDIDKDGEPEVFIVDERRKETR